MNEFRELKYLRDDIVNKALEIGFIFGVISYLVTLIRAFKYGFNWTFVAITLVVIYLGVLVYYRSKININYKVGSVVIVVLMALITGLSKFGFLVSSKAYIILIPIFVSFVLGYRKALLLLIFFSTVYVMFGVLYIYEVIPFKVDVLSYVLSPISWAMDISIIILTAAALLVVGKKYSDSILQNLALIRQQNKDLNIREQKFFLLFDNSFDAILIADKGIIIDANNSATQVLRISKEEVIGKHIIEFAPEKQPNGTLSIDFMNQIAQEVSEGAIKSFEFRHKRADGELFDSEVHISSIKFNNQELYQILIKDITEKKLHQLQINNYKQHLENLVEQRTGELHQANINLVESNIKLKKQHSKLEKSIAEIQSMQEQLIEKEKMATIGVMTSGVAHEINNPLNFIQTGLYTLQNTIQHSCLSDEEMMISKEVIRYMEEGVDRISNIVKGVGSFSLKEHSGIAQCNIVEILNNCLIVLSHEIKNKINVIKTFSSKELLVVGSEEGLHQVFFNIIFNSVQAIKNEGEIKIIAENDQNKEIVVTIKDNGIGMSKETQSKIFVPFFTRKKPGEGSGLGMAIVYGIVKEHKGKILVNSKLGEGTQIKIILPILAEKRES